MNKSKLCITPFTQKEIAIEMCCPEGYIIDSLVSPKGILNDGSDVSILNNHKTSHSKVTNDLIGSIERCDSVLISDCGSSLKEYASKAIDISLKEKKEIICCLNLNPTEKIKYQELSRKNDTVFNYIDYEEVNSKKFENYQFHKPIVPVVFIGEMFEDCDSYVVFCKLMERLSSENVKALAIGEDKYNFLFGQHTIKYCSEIDPKLNVLKINRYVNNLVNSNHPDIILVKSPLPMIMFSNHTTYDFGITSYLIAQAIPADFLVLCNSSSLCNNELFHMLDDSFNSKFGLGIDVMHISNQIIDSSLDAEKGVEILYNDYNHHKQTVHNLQKQGLSVYDVFNDKDFEKMFSKLTRETLKIPYGVI